LSSSDSEETGAGHWYGGGLRFSCTRCGNCCTGSGTVRVDNAEQEAIAAQLGIDTASLRRAYLHPLGNREFTLKEKENTDCIFFVRGEGCSIYSVRPRQCRTWPFWRSNLASRRHWLSAASSCPGMNQGTLHSPEEIEKSEAQDGTSGIVPELS